jgi:hypothetical protein
MLRVLTGDLFLGADLRRAYAGVVATLEPV